MSEKLRVEYHDHLNPKIWNGMDLKPEVLKKLRDIANKFIEWCDAPKMVIKDIVMVGSGCNYNWDPTSDIDIHILVRNELKGDCKEFADSFFDVKNKRFKEVFKIKVYDMDVEVIVDDSDHPATSQSMYSIRDGKWIHKPVYKEPEYDEDVAKSISDKWKKKFKALMAKKDASYDELEGMRDTFKDFRSKRLKKGGEFDVANIAYKDLRRIGIIDKMKEKAQQAMGRDLSLKK
jgi:hypothetical protein